ncbi:MAG: DMT family transporter [Anaerolineales bacterium]|nr:DMT family transporter [Anaerolineales bacterium]MCB0013454.1 DMT family transporter [Anaerolineales bacterium]MCB8958915.1 DMT family transporter [Ardenticatenales bacterium]
MKNERAIAILQTIGILVLMSLGTVLIKLALTDVEPFTFAWVSVTIGMVALALYTFGIRREPIPRNLPTKVWLTILVIGFLNFFVARLTTTLSLDLLEATTNTYLVNFVGFVTMGMSIFILKESPTLFQVLGAAVALAGLRIFFPGALSDAQLRGVFLILVGIMGIAYTNNITRKLLMTTQQLSSLIISTIALLFGGGLLLLAGLITDWPPHVGSLANVGTLFYTGLVMIAFSMSVWNYILRTLRSYEASILGASTVIWTALLAVPILGETLTINKIIGIALMLIGLALVQVRRGQLRLPGWRK